MPRNRVINENEIKIDEEEDYLDVDKPLPNQNFYCISFVSPEKVLKQKELFMYYHYEQAFYKLMHDTIDKSLSNLIENCEDGNISISEIIKLKKESLELCNKEKTSFDEFKIRFDDFKYRDEDKINEVFDKQNNYQTSVRGIKVRGVFDTRKEADIRAKVLQRLDPHFDVFVGQVGYWCPWEPNPHKIEDIEYSDINLNKLVKEYKNNEAKKDEFYTEQKQQRTKDVLSIEERIKHQQGLNNFNNPNMQSHEITNLNNETTTPIITNISNNVTSLINNITDEENILNSDDPWLQHKKL